MGERCNRTAEVRGSNPLSSTKVFAPPRGPPARPVSPAPRRQNASLRVLPYSARRASGRLREEVSCFPLKKARPGGGPASRSSIRAWAMRRTMGRAPSGARCSPWQGRSSPRSASRNSFSPGRCCSASRAWCSALRRSSLRSGSAVFLRKSRRSSPEFGRRCCSRSSLSSAGMREARSGDGRRTVFGR